MLKITLVDANVKAKSAFRGTEGSDDWIKGVSSIVGYWIKWEAERAGIVFAPHGEAEIVLLIYAGAVDWAGNCRAALRRAGIEPLAIKRAGAPYVIAGGSVDTIPFTALEIADAVAIGESYTFLREVFRLAKRADSLAPLRSYIIDYPHALERVQLEGIRRDPARPWLLAEALPEPLASPDPEVDWGSPPPTRIDDGVVRVIGSKGCWLRCKFCSTTYRQPFTKNPDEAGVLNTVKGLNALGERVQIVTNDVASLPYFDKIARFGSLDHQSLTIKGVRKPEDLQFLINGGLKIARFGVEGVSERLQTAFGKPITNDELLYICETLQNNKRQAHMFFIVNAPYEDPADWESFKGFFERLVALLNFSLYRLKFTTFVPTPPTPLMRFAPSLEFDGRIQGVKDWLAHNAATRHTVMVWGRKSKTQVTDYAEQLQVDKRVIKEMCFGTDRTTDLAPTLEDFYRLPSMVIDWPTPAKTLWRSGEKYREMMGDKVKA